MSKSPSKPEQDLSEMASCACFNLRKTARAITQYYEKILAPSGLKATQLSLLAVLQASGPIAISQLAERLLMDRTTLTRNLKPLERDGLILTAPGADQRTRLVQLTAEGQQRLLAALPYWKEAHDSVKSRMGQDWQSLHDALQAVQRSVES